ncbi:MAG TPA: TRAP transporter large permease subunit, partial [Candidatus Saccharimonadales bacterium]|nr:TRAP transporter large permease subunit [Candidatus Saccharimonadales bacterium]
ASSLSWTLTVVGLASHLVGLLTVGSTSGALFLVATLLLLIALGAVLEGVPAIVVMAPLLLPLAPRFGVDPLQYGIVLVLAMGFGSFIPPLGVGVYVAAAIFRVQIGPVIPRMAPYLLALFVGLLIVAFVPWFSLALPHAFHVQR